MVVRYVLRLGALMLATLATSTSAQTITLKVHHFLPTGSTTHAKLLVPWCDRIEREAAGRLK